MFGSFNEKKPHEIKIQLYRGQTKIFSTGFINFKKMLLVLSVAFQEAVRTESKLSEGSHNFSHYVP